MLYWCSSTVLRLAFLGGGRDDRLFLDYNYTVLNARNHGAFCPNCDRRWVMMGFLIMRVIPFLLILAGIVGIALVVNYNFLTLLNGSIGILGGLALLACFGYIIFGLIGLAFWWEK